MAFSQPTYPIDTTSLVSYLGTYIDARNVYLQTQRQYDKLLAADLIDADVNYHIPVYNSSTDTEYLVYDTASRTIVDGLGSPEVGTLAIVQGPAANIDVDSGMIHMAHTTSTTGDDKSFVATNVDSRDCEIGFAFKGPTFVSGNSQIFAFLRYASTSATYRMRALCTGPTAAWGLTGQKVVTTSSDLSAQVSTGIANVADAWFRMRVQCLMGGTNVTLRGKLWLEGTFEPASWITFNDTPSPAYTGAGDAGVYSRMSSLNVASYLRDVTDVYVLPYRLLSVR